MTKNQHYVWRHYLSPWTQNNSSIGKISCLRNNRIFTTSLSNIACERYFYELKSLSKFEYEFLHGMFVGKATGVQADTNLHWLATFCFADEHIEEKTQIFENHHSRVEKSAREHLDQLRKGDVSFWSNEKHREKFAFFLATQYFRTKWIKDGIAQVCAKVNIMFPQCPLRPDHLWLPFSLLSASNVSTNILHNKPILLFAQDNSLIVGDQPAINVYATFDDRQPEKFELYYPITPTCALLLTEQDDYNNGQTIQLSPQDIAHYNKLQWNCSNDQVFAREESHLQRFINS